MKRISALLAFLIIISITLCGCDFTSLINPDATSSGESISLDEIPEFDGKTAYAVVNDGVPFFEESDMTTTSYESYSELDSLGRCGAAMACIGKDIMPTEERGSIGSVKPSGWVTVKYDIVDGKYLYNRCHLIGYQLTAENANKQNLITGTRFLNMKGMLIFENEVADYIKETDNHVLYRVTPIFEGANLLASGVLIEAKSVEDNGKGIQFCVYSYNAQPGIVINYKNGDSHLDDGTSFEPDSTPDDNGGEGDEEEKIDTGIYVINKSTKKVHKEECRYADSIKDENKEVYEGKLEDLLIDGFFSACGTCKPE